MADIVIDAELVLLLDMWQQYLYNDILLTHLRTKFQKEGDNEQKLNAEWWKNKMGYTLSVWNTWHCSYLYLW